MFLYAKINSLFSHDIFYYVFSFVQVMNCGKMFYVYYSGIFSEMLLDNSKDIYEFKKSSALSYCLVYFINLKYYYNLRSDYCVVFVTFLQYIFFN